MSRWPLMVGIIGTFVGFAFLFGLALVMPATAKLANFEHWQTLPPPQQEAAQILKLALLALLVLSAMVMFGGLGTLVYAVLQRKRRVA